MTTDTFQRDAGDVELRCRGRQSAYHVILTSTKLQ
jgi:hypothetical protein